MTYLVGPPPDPETLDVSVGLQRHAVDVCDACDTRTATIAVLGSHCTDANENMVTLCQPCLESALAPGATAVSDKLPVRCDLRGERSVGGLTLRGRFGSVVLCASCVTEALEFSQSEEQKLHLG